MVKKVLGRFGLKLSRLRNLPIGNDLCLDLSRINPADRISTIFDIGANAGRSALGSFEVDQFLGRHGFRFVALYEQFVHENMSGAMSTNALFVNRDAFGNRGR